MSSKRLALLAGCIGTLTLTACTTTQKLDLPAARQSNMQQDIELWKRSQQPIPDLGLTLQAAIDMGLTNNLALRAAEFERAMFDDNELAAKLEMLPDLTLSAQRFRRNNQPRQDFINDADNQVTQSNVRSAFRTGTQSQLELTWSVLDFGLSYVRSRQAGYEKLAQETRTARQAQLLALDITDAFWRSALAEDALDYLRTAEAELSARKTDMQGALDAGLADPLGVTMTSSRLVDVEIAIRDLQAAVSSARINLARLLGLPMQQEFRLIREPIRPILSHLPRLPQLNSEAMLRYALLNRPELYESDLNELIREDDVRAALLSVFPDLTFGFGYFYDDNRLLRNNHWNRASASISWNLLNIPATLASKKGRENAVEMTRFQRLQTTAGVIAQVHLALLDYAAKTDRFLLRDEASGLADDIERIRRANFAAGENNVLQVSESQLTAVNSRMQLDQAVVELLVSYSRLQSTLGMSPEFLPYEMTAICLPENELAGACLAEPGVYTPLAQTYNDANINIEQLPVAEIKTIDEPSNQAQVATAPAEINKADAVKEMAALISATPYPLESSTVQSSGDGSWIVFIGTYNNTLTMQESIEQAQQVDITTFNKRNNVNEKLDDSLYRTGFELATKNDARAACDKLMASGIDCWIAIKPANTQIADNQ